MLDGSQREEGVQEGEHCGLVVVEPSPRAGQLEAWQSYLEFWWFGT